MSKVEVTWITDAAYLVPTILSVASFLRHVDRRCRVVVPTHERAELEPMLRRSLPHVEVGQANALDSPGRPRDSPTIRKRLARMELMGLTEEPALFVDSDTAFGPRAKELVETIERAAGARAFVAGVIEYKSAADAYLYFRPRSPHGAIRFSSPSEQSSVRSAVFGHDWNKVLSAPQPNNGLLAAGAASGVADAWRALYQSGLTHTAVNEADDQVPLAAALSMCGLQLTPLPSWANSLGATSGPYAMFHAYAGLWCDELRAATADLADLSQFSAEWRAVIGCLERKSRHAFSPMPGPQLHLSLSGFFEYAHLLDDWADTCNTVVEVGRSNGRGTAYLAELLSNRAAGARFASLRHSEPRVVLTPDRWFEDRQLCSVVDLAGPFDAGWWLETPLDAVLLNSVSGSDDLAAPLTEWFERLRPGGVVGGPCYGVSDPFLPGVRTSVDRFAADRGIRVAERGGSFELRKPGP